MFEVLAAGFLLLALIGALAVGAWWFIVVASSATGSMRAALLMLAGAGVCAIGALWLLIMT